MSDRRPGQSELPELVLYGHPDSGHALKVALALALADLPCRRVWTDIRAAPHSRPAQFRAASPIAIAIAAQDPPRTEGPRCTIGTGLRAV